MSEYGDRIDALLDRVREDRAGFEPPPDPPDESAALEYLRRGAGEAVAVYVDARTGDPHRFDAEAFDRLQRALNESLSLYAACYGVDAAFDRNVREAAELLVDTHNIHETAQALTHVPSREEFSVGVSED
jgi:hypothetical protein